MHSRFTNRLSELKTTVLNESFREALEHIEENGLTIMHVLGDDKALAWTYSTGLYDSYGQPEIIASGFPSGLASSILNQAARRMEKGGIIKQNVRIAGFISDVDVVFRPVESKWKARLMLRTCWFYGNSDFPAMQCICPDFENHFPWEKGFDQRWRNRQVQFFEGAEITKLEKQFWNEHDPGGQKVQ
jgi:Domain of unknown function (DUF4262)